MAETTTTRLSLRRWSAGTDTPSRSEFDTNFANIESLSAIYGQGTRSARPAAGTAGRFYEVVGDATAENNGLVFYDNGSAWVLVGAKVEDQTVRASGAAVVPFTVQGAAAQTARLQEWKNSTGTVLAWVAADGTMHTSSGQLIRAGSTDTLTNKTINLDSNTLTGTKAQFNAALSDGDFATTTGTETLTNKTLTSPVINGIGSSEFVLKTADEMVTTTSNQDDNHLVTSTLVAGARYLIEMELFTHGANHTIVLNPSWPTSTTDMSWSVFGPGIPYAGTGQDNTRGDASFQGFKTSSAVNVGTGRDYATPIRLRGQFVAGTANPWKLRWYTASGGQDVTVLAGSWLRIERIA